MQKKFLSNLFLLVVLNLLIKPFFILGIDAEVQNRVGEIEYGNYFALLNFSFLLNILLDLGITNYNTRNIAQHPQLIEKHFSKIFWLRMVLFFLYGSFTAVSAIFTGYSSHEFYLLIWLMFNQFLVAVIQFSRSNFGGLHLFRTDAIVSVLDRLLMILFCSMLLWTEIAGDEFKIEWFVYSQTAAYLITAVVAMVLLRYETGGIKINLKKDFSMVLLKNSFPYAVLIFLMMMYSRLDSVMLERLLADGDEQAGIYAQGYRYLDAVNMFALLFAGILLPVFARLLQHKENIFPILDLSVRLLLSASVTVGLVAFLFQENLLDLRYDTVTAESARSFGYLILSFIPVSITYIFGTLLTANKNLRQLNWMAFGGLILNVMLNYLMIPHYKAEGAALATLITQSLTALVQLIIAYRIFRINVNWNIYGGLMMLAVAVFVTYYFTKEMDFMKSISLTCLSAVVIILITGLFKFSDIRQMIYFKNQD